MNLGTVFALDNLMRNGDYEIRSAIVLSDHNASSDAALDYQPIYQVMFLEHDRLPAQTRFELPPLDVKINPRFQ